MKKGLELFNKITEDLITNTKLKDEYEVEYELEKCRMLFSAEVNGLRNQDMRDAQVTLMLDQKGMYRKMAELRTNAKLSWYRWSAIKSLIDGKEGDNDDKDK